MKKYVASNRDLIVFDTDTMDARVVENCRTAIDWMYIAPHDGVLSDGTPVKEGQLVVLMYDVNETGLELPRKAIVLQDEVFAEYVRKYNEFYNAKRIRYVDTVPNACCPA